MTTNDNKVNYNLGKYHLRVRPEYKAKISLIVGYRKLEGADFSSKTSVVEEALDFYYEVLKEMHYQKMVEENTGEETSENVEFSEASELKNDNFSR